jgi:hypothetical protein
MRLIDEGFEETPLLAHLSVAAEAIERVSYQQIQLAPRRKFAPIGIIGSPRIV